MAVVEHYNQFLKMRLTDAEKTFPLPPVLGIAAVAGGVVLLIAGARKHT